MLKRIVSIFWSWIQDYRRASLPLGASEFRGGWVGGFSERSGLGRRDPWMTGMLGVCKLLYSYSKGRRFFWMFFLNQRCRFLSKGKLKLDTFDMRSKLKLKGIPNSQWSMYISPLNWLKLVNRPYIWSNYSDLTRPGPPNGALVREMGPLISGKSRSVKY